MTMGRPTAYREEYCEEIINYFKNAEEFPTLAGFCVSIGVSKNTILNWSKSHPDFLCAVSICKAIQEDNLVRGGLKERYNPSFAKFVAMNYVGMSETQSIEVHSKLSEDEINSSSPEQLKEILDRYLR